MNVKKIALALTALFFGVVALAFAQAAPTVLQPEDLTVLVQLGGRPWTAISLSADGRRVAYVTADPSIDSAGTTFDPRGPGRKMLWVADVTSGATQRIGDPSVNDWAPVWSPDGRQLAFYSGNGNVARLYIWNASTGVTLRMNLAIPATWGAYPVLWLADSEHLIVSTIAGPISTESAVPAATPVPTPSPAATVFLSTPPPGRAETTGNAHVLTQVVNDVRFNLTLLDTQTGVAQVIGKPIYPIGMRLSPSSRYLAYLVDKGKINNDVNSRELFDAVVVDLHTLTSRIVATNILTIYSGNTLTWSHNERYLAYVGGLYPGDEDPTVKDYNSSFPGYVYLVNLQSRGEPHRVSMKLLSRFSGPLFWSANDTTIAGVDESEKTLWQISLASGAARKVIDLGESKFGTADGQGALQIHGTTTFTFVTAPNGEQRVYSIDPHWKLTLLTRSSQSMSQLRFSNDGTRIVYVGEDIRHTPDIWTTNDRFANVRQLTHINPQLASRAMGDVTDVSWHTPDGAIYHGVIILPANYQAGKRYPTITWIYGGENEGTDNRNKFGLVGANVSVYMNLQLLASHGYAVFVPNTTLHLGTPMTDLAKEVLPGVDRTIAMGIADPKRLGIYGQSYGGYSTLSLIVQTHRFKAAVAMSGIDDLFAFFGTMYPNGFDGTGYTESEQGRMGGSPWQYRRRYINNSPFFFLNKVSTPVLLEYGATDKFSAINLEQAFVSLRSLGKTAELVSYADEGHVLEKPSNQVDLSNRILKWFDSYLAPEH